MKANELMLGDWLLLKSVDYVEGVIKYVEEKKKVTTNMLDQLYNQETGLFGIDNLYTIYAEPIPLTAEILEKNGFNIEIAPYTPNWMRCIFNKNFFLEDRLKGLYHFNGNNLAKIQYVHELQHALKLCKIDKQIEL